MKTIIKSLIYNVQKDNIGAYAAQAALFLLMSFIPFMLVLLSLIRYTPLTEKLVLEYCQMVIPDMVSPTVLKLVEEVYNNSGGVLLISLVSAIFTSAKTIQSLRNGLNIVYEIEETRNWFVLRFRAMLETLALIIAIVMLMLTLMFGRNIRNLLEVYFPFLPLVTETMLKMRLLILFFALILIFTVIYKFMPNRKASFRSQLLGAVLCSVMWYLLSFAIRIYSNIFHGFSLYGSLTTIMLILFWLYFAMFIFLVCGEINNAIEFILMEFRKNNRRPVMVNRPKSRQK